MATIFTHPIIAVGLSPFFGQALKSKTVLFAGIILTIIPDLDVIGLRLGIPYEHVLGHRGISHSLLFAFVIGGTVAWLLTKHNKKYFYRIWIYLFLCTASHGVLDAFTNGGHGIAFFAPFINERYFFPVTPIEVSTLNITRFFEGQGVPVIQSELLWIWIPGFFIFLLAIFCSKFLMRSSKHNNIDT